MEVERRQAAAGRETGLDGDAAAAAADAWVHVELPRDSFLPAL